MLSLDVCREKHSTVKLNSMYSIIICINPNRFSPDLPNTRIRKEARFPSFSVIKIGLILLFIAINSVDINHMLDYSYFKMHFQLIG